MNRGHIESHVRQAVAEFDGIVSVYLFGSFAEDRAHRESDVDVGVLLYRERYPDETARFEQRLSLSSALSLVDGRSADVVILNDAPPTFARTIVTRGARLVCRDAEKDRVFVRDVQLQAPDLERFLERMRAIKLETLGRQ